MTESAIVPFDFLSLPRLPAPNSFPLPLIIFVKIFKKSRAASETSFVVFVRHSYAGDDAIDSRSFLSRKLRVF